MRYKPLYISLIVDMIMVKRVMVFQSHVTNTNSNNHKWNCCRQHGIARETFLLVVITTLCFKKTRTPTEGRHKFG